MKAFSSQFSENVQCPRTEDEGCRQLAVNMHLSGRHLERCERQTVYEPESSMRPLEVLEVQGVS